MNRSHVVLALAAAVVGLVVGRAIPRDASSPGAVVGAASAVPVTAPADCKADRAQLVSTRTQLAICMAYRIPPAEPDPAAASPSASVSAAPTDALVHPEQARVLAMLAAAEALPHVEYVIVRHKDGTVKGYLPEDWPADRDDGQIIARESPGRSGYYAVDAGPHASPVALHDLAGPDGVITMGKAKFVWEKSDAGAP